MLKYKTGDKMNIDLEKAKQEFLKYTEKFDLEEKHIKRKQLHSLRVMEISKKIAESLKLTQEEIELATLIGLLHDIARFEQYTKFETFNDLMSIDHADYGVEILNKDIRKYIEQDKYDEIIKKAIKNHNKYAIEEGLSEKELLFAKIIRDADKLDIFYEAVNMFWKDTKEDIEKTVISENVYEQFIQNKIIKREKNKEQDTVDKVIAVIAFIFDINFRESLGAIRQENYINKILDRFNFEDKDTKIKMEEIRKKANKYVEKGW